MYQEGKGLTCFVFEAKEDAGFRLLYCCLFASVVLDDSVDRTGYDDHVWKRENVDLLDVRAAVAGMPSSRICREANQA